MDEWPPDIMRRSCWSYLYNMDGEITLDKMARIAGNSAQVLDVHYVKTLPSGLGEEYFSIGLPNKKSKVDWRKTNFEKILMERFPSKAIKAK